MSSTIGSVVPIALGIALSPIPILAVIFTLFAPTARTNGLAYLLGWVVGLSLESVVGTALFDNVDFGFTDEESFTGSLIQILLGLLVVGFAVRSLLRNRKTEETQASLPVWMRVVDAITPLKALGIGLLLSTTNPKNFSLIFAAAVTLGQERLTTLSVAFVLVLFIGLASLGIAIPVALYIAGGISAAKTLNSFRTWLDANNAIVTSALLLVISVVFTSRGLIGLL